MKGITKTEDGLLELSGKGLSKDFIAFFDEGVGVIDKSSITPIYPMLPILF